MPTTATRSRAVADAGLPRAVTAVLVVLGAFLTFMLIYAFAQEDAPSPYDDSLPSPMGGPARTAPGEASGSVTLAGLEVAGSEVAMGAVPLGVTVVPQWTVTNPTPDPVTFVAGQPQVLEGCCPGPIYADEAEVMPGEEIEVPASGSVELAFPLQMHEGMDGPHHLAIPLVTADGGEQTAVHVTGDFSASAPIR